MSAYMAYTVKTKTNMPIFKKRTFSVSRRFSDFLGLHDKLVEKYLRSGRIIPPAPQKSVIGNKYITKTYKIIYKIYNCLNCNEKKIIYIHFMIILSFLI